MLINKRLRVAKQHLPVTDRDHIIMEHAPVNHMGVLLSKNRLIWIELIKPCHRFACRARLPGGIALRLCSTGSIPAIDKELYARLAIITPQTVMVRGAFITESGNGRQRLVYSKVIPVSKNALENGLRRWRFTGAMQQAAKVSHREMHFPVQRIG